MAARDRLLTFHPRIVSAMAAGMGLSLIAVFGVVWFRFTPETRGQFDWFQRLTLLAFFVAVLWILYRMATLRVTAYADRIRVRNVFKSYTLQWSEISALRFRPGDAWLQLFTGEAVGRTALAVEPMTCPPDAFRTGQDLIVLNPGESHTTTFHVSV